jgi:hypothetical protein
LDECHEVLSVLVLVGGLHSVEHGSAPLLACAWTGVASRRPPLEGTEVTPLSAACDMVDEVTMREPVAAERCRAPL